MKLSAIALGLGLLVCTAQASAHPAERADRRGDRIEQRLDQRGDRIDTRLDRAAGRAEAHGRDLAAERFDTRGDRIDRRLDRRGQQIDRRVDRRGARRAYCCAASSSSLSR